MDRKQAEEKTAELKWILKYNSTPGMHTFHLCECGKGCRRYKCNDCIKKELDELKDAFRDLPETEDKK